MNMYDTRRRRSAFTPYARAVRWKLLGRRIVAIAELAPRSWRCACCLFSFALTLSVSHTPRLSDLTEFLITPSYRNNDITSITGPSAEFWITGVSAVPCRAVDKYAALRLCLDHAIRGYIYKVAYS